MRTNEYDSCSLGYNFWSSSLLVMWHICKQFHFWSTFKFFKLDQKRNKKYLKITWIQFGEGPFLIHFLKRFSRTSMNRVKILIHLLVIKFRYEHEVRFDTLWSGSKSWLLRWVSFEIVKYNAIEIRDWLLIPISNMVNFKSSITKFV